MGADAIEPDLVATRDGVLVARHEPEIGATTDAGARFASRRATKEVDGVSVEGWFCEDLTLAELRTLRARERLPDLRPANGAFDGAEPVPTFDEILALRAALSAELGREIVVYPELKHPSRSRELGLPLEEPLLAALSAHGLDGREAPVFVQCFERGSLERVAASCGVRRVKLMAAGEGGVGLTPPYAGAESRTPTGRAAELGAGARSASAATGALGEIATYADAVGPAKELLLPHDGDGRSLPPTRFVEEAHAAGLLVHPWTFRAENAFLPAELRSGGDPATHGDLAAELRAALGLGVDGLFCDHPDTAAAVLGARDGPAR